MVGWTRTIFFPFFSFFFCESFIKIIFAPYFPEILPFQIYSSPFGIF